MVDSLVGAVGQGGAGSDGVGCLGGGVVGLEASDLARVDIADEAVVLPVVGPADVLPVAARGDPGESVVAADTEGGSQDKEAGGEHGDCVVDRTAWRWYQQEGAGWKLELDLEPVALGTVRGLPDSKQFIYRATHRIPSPTAPLPLFVLARLRVVAWGVEG